MFGIGTERERVSKCVKILIVQGGGVKNRVR